MNVYSLALFAHIVGVLGLFIGMGLQWAITLRLRRAETVAQVRNWAGLAGSTGKIGPVAGALLLVAGIYMMAVAWGMTPWIVVSLVAMLFMMALGMGVTSRRLQAVQQAAAVEADSEAVLPGLERKIHDPVLWISAQVVPSTALGIVFLMTTKPGLGGSLLVMGVALVLGAVVGGLTARQRLDPQEVAGPAEKVSLS